jgi:hypothetical protein
LLPSPSAIGGQNESSAITIIISRTQRSSRIVKAFMNTWLFLSSYQYLLVYALS